MKLLFLGTLLLIIGTLPSGCSQKTWIDESPAPTYAIETAGEGDHVWVEEDDEGARIIIESEKGIGSTTISSTAGSLPGKLIIELRLSGLEQFEFAYADTVVSISVSSGADHTVHESVKTPAGEQAIAQDSPFWMEVVREAPAGSEGSKITETGYFQVTSPQDFAEGRYDTVSMHWIDFYR